MLVWLVIAIAPLIAHAAPVVERVRPQTGQVGHVVMVQGTGLAGADIEVRFGRAEALAVHHAAGSDRVISMLVPNKVDPRDPDTVTLAVIVDGIEAMAPDGPLRFTYSIPQPSASITDFTTADPERPKSVLPDQPFVLTLSGSSFLTGRRVPERCMALQGSLQVDAEEMIGPPGETTVSFSFNGLPLAGDYEFLIAFSDGSGASILAPDFVPGGGPIFGLPPNIESVSFEWDPLQAVQCDFTRIVEDFVCSLGVPGATAQPGVFIGGTFTHVRADVRVTDPDSTSSQSNVLLVGASYLDPVTHAELTFVLFDDGSLANFSFAQKAAVPEDCATDPTGMTCTCNPRNYPAVSGDVVPYDTVFSRDLAFVDSSTVASGLLQDCILQQVHDVPISAVAGSTLEFTIDAVDREGNDAVWPSRPAVTIGTGEFGCTGDECGCCLLNSGGTLTDCKGMPGMPSPDFPAGICMSIP